MSSSDLNPDLRARRRLSPRRLVVFWQKDVGWQRVVHGTETGARLLPLFLVLNILVLSRPVLLHVRSGGINGFRTHSRSRGIIASQPDDGLLLIEDDVGLCVDAWANHTDAGCQAIHDAPCRSRRASVGFERPRSEWRVHRTAALGLITQADLWSRQDAVLAVGNQSKC
jgi:hypothetical protein